MARWLIVMARLDRAIGINTMNRVMARSGRAMTANRRALILPRVGIKRPAACTQIAQDPDLDIVKRIFVPLWRYLAIRGARTSHACFAPRLLRRFPGLLGAEL